MNENTKDPDQPPSCIAIVDDTACVCDADLEWFHTTLEAIVQHVEPCVERFAARIVGDEAMSAAHLRYSGIEGSTDVLTFVTAPDPIEVDVLLCLHEADRRVAEFSHTTVHELLLYAVHGLLHAAGFDDHDPSSFEAIHAEEDRLLTLVGVGDLFDPARHARGNA